MRRQYKLFLNDQIRIFYRNIKLSLLQTENLHYPVYEIPSLKQTVTKDYIEFNAS